MLKIRDEVDLKELEKYDFKYDKVLNSYCKGDIDIRIENRHICIIFNFAEEDILYDLIKADLVEKLED